MRENLDLGFYFVRLLFFGLFSAPFITLISAMRAGLKQKL